MEKELIKIIFTILDKTEYDYPQIRDSSIELISKLYNKDNIETINCYLGYCWSEVDNIDGDAIINDYIRIP